MKDTSEIFGENVFSLSVMKARLPKETFKEVKNQFWDAKHANSQDRFREIISRKEDTLKKIRTEIDDLQVKEYETEDYDRIHSIQKRIEEKKVTAESIENDIKEL